MLKLVLIREKKDELLNYENLLKENKCFNVFVDCKSVLYEGFWVFFCLKFVEEYLLYIDSNVEKKM